MAHMRTARFVIACLITLSAAALPALDVPRPDVPDVAYATVSAAALPGFLQLHREQRPRGDHAVLLPLDRLAAIDRRQLPVGTGLRDTLVLTFAYAEPLVLTFAEGRSAATPDQVMAALQQAARWAAAQAFQNSSVK